MTRAKYELKPEPQHLLWRIVCFYFEHDWRPRVSGGDVCHRCHLWRDSGSRRRFPAEWNQP